MCFLVSLTRPSSPSLAASSLPNSPNKRSDSTHRSRLLVAQYLYIHPPISCARTSILSYNLIPLSSSVPLNLFFVFPYCFLQLHHPLGPSPLPVLPPNVPTVPTYSAAYVTSRLLTAVSLLSSSVLLALFLYSRIRSVCSSIVSSRIPRTNERTNERMHG